MANSPGKRFSPTDTSSVARQSNEEQLARRDIAKHMGDLIEKLRHDVSNICTEDIAPDDAFFLEFSRLNIFDEIVKGRNGVTFYKGTYNGDPVAVKKFPKGHVRIDDHVIGFLANHPHQNVVFPHKVLFRGEFGFVIQELCHCSLQDLIEACGSATDFAVSSDDTPLVVEHKRKLSMLRDSMLGIDLSSDTFLKLTKDIALGLEFLHRNEIIHGNLRPNNIMIVRTEDCKNLVAKVADTGVSASLLGYQTCLGNLAPGLGWQAPELLQSSQSPTKYSNMFSLGCILFTCLIRGDHPYGSIVERDVNIMNGVSDLSSLDNNQEAHQLISNLIQLNHKSRMMVSTMLAHPIYWNPNRRMHFLCHLSDRVQQEKENKATSAFLKRLNNNTLQVFGGQWNCHIEDHIIRILKKKGEKYDYKTVDGLLKFIRNQWDHANQFAQVMKSLGNPAPEPLETFFSVRFPHLFMECYKTAWRHLRSNPFWNGLFERKP